MNEPHRIDPERLAALLDGRLSSSEADAVRAQLAEADDDVLAGYTDAIAIAAELDGDGRVLSITSARRRWAISSIAAIAAALLAVVVVRGPRSGIASADGVTAYASALPSTVRLPDTPIWSVTRGADAVVSERGRGVRIGALFADLQVALTRQDTLSTPIAESMAAVLSDVPGAQTVVSRLQVAARSPAPTRDQDLRRLGLDAMRLVDLPFSRAGAWIESARLASFSGDVSFVNRYRADASLRDIMKQSGMSEVQRNALDQLVRLSNAEQREPVAFAKALELLLRELAR